MKFISSILIIAMFTILLGCVNQPEKDDFQYSSEKFADLRIIRFKVPGFENLSLNEKKLLYYLSEAALSGRDILYDQNYKHNLTIRRTLETIVEHYSGDTASEDYKNFLVYTKRVWFANGIHHHYSADKIIPNFSQDYFKELVTHSPDGKFPLMAGETTEALAKRLTPYIFNPELDGKRVNLDPESDLILRSANNYYEGLTQKEVEGFYAKRINKNDPTPVSHGLNSKLIRENGVIKEKVWKVGGMYTEAIEKMVYWLKKAEGVALNDQQKIVFGKLIEFYETGDLKKFDEFNVAWVNDTESKIDFIHGYIETYGDALNYRGAYESVIQLTDVEATRRIGAIGAQAQWFEDNSTIMDAHKKENVKGIIARVVNTVVGAGDVSPGSPIGVNLPNANWIRAAHGSKSVTLGNITHAYSESAKDSGFLDEFGYSAELNALENKYSTLASDLHTDMHEVIGHASGKINEGVGTPKETLKNYSSSMEEARADLVALYYMMDKKLVDIGVAPNLDVGKVEYISYIRNGLLYQLRRIKLGDDIEQSHMRNRQMISKWAYEKGMSDNVIEKKVVDGRTFFVINDYEKLRGFFGELLRETQRIKSEGDYEAAKSLIETYGVKVDQELHKEVLERFAKMNTAPYGGFINPKLTPVMTGDEITDVKIEYPMDFTKQMLGYAKKYSFLPDYN